MIIEILTVASHPPSHTIVALCFLLAESVSWVDGTRVDYSNWPGKSPNTKVLPADACATMKAVDGVWQLSQCNQQLGFVCKTIASSE